MSRFTRNDKNGDAALLWQASVAPGSAPAPARLRPAHASLIGMMAAYEVFRDFTQAPGAETDGAVVIVDLATGDAVREEVLVDPRDTSGRSTVPPLGLAADLDAPAVPEQVVATGDHEHDYEDMRRFMKLVGEHVGVVTGFDDDEIDQTPVKIARCTVDPGVSDAGPALGFAFETTSHARRRATENAILEYVANLGPLPATDADVSRRIPASDLVVATGMDDGSAAGWIAGRTLTGEMVQVPVAAVYARSAVNSAGAFEHTSAGEGAAVDLAGAVRAGVRSALAYEGVTALVRGEKVAEAALSDMDEAVRFLTRAATLLELDVAVHKLPAAAPAVAVMAVRPGTTDYAVGVGADESEATVDALSVLIGRTLTTGLTGRDQLLVPGADPRIAHVAAGNGISSVEEGPLASTLHSQGREAVVVETTPADVLAAGAMRTVRVLLTRPR